ncbi:hypothetical protein [Prolixibacter sp. SD074]|jgi:uncharacterized protein YdcH (DUF465 family)|uniref:hypothetical protein n=1 Tax=Prolixibacter sp. SD074 TaxID=2652391 RepID=UPI001298EB76|nr:hypothetical protein [Prolixibacter sp. SD074]
MKRGYSSGVFFIWLMSMLFVSCGPSPSEKAAQQINRAGMLLSQGDTVKAVRSLDSIATMYPEAVAQIKQADEMKKRVFVAELITLRANRDSLDDKIQKVSKNFTTKKDEFDEYTQYIPKRQTVNRSWARSFIQVHLDASGRIYLSSNYYGDKWLNHVAVRVYDGKLSARTDTVPLNDVNNHHSEFLDKKWEQVSYKDGKSDDVIKFIAGHTDLKLKAVFLGKRYYYIVLETFDKEAVKNAYDLSLLLKAKNKLDKKIKSLEARVKETN